MLDLFSPLKCLFLLNAAFPRITRLNLKTSICPLAPVIDLFFLSCVSITFIPAEDYRPAFRCSASPEKGQEFRPFSILHNPLIDFLFGKCILRWNEKDDPSLCSYTRMTLLPFPLCISIVTYPSSALDSWLLLMGKKLSSSTGSLEVTHLRQR